MTGGVSRIQKSTQLFEPLTKGLKSKNVLDVGCGTGCDSFALAQLGCNVIGIDNSTEMIHKASESTIPDNFSLKFEIDDLRRLESISDEWADLTICRGNTLPHLLSIDDLKLAIKALARVTKKDGVLILGWLNYIPVLKERSRLIGASGDEKSVFFRFNDFKEDGSLDFNIVAMTFDNDVGKWRADWQSTRLIPWTADDVGMLMVGNGWDELEIGSDLNRNDFDPDASKDVFIFAVRG